MDTLGFEPRAFRMRSGCDTTTPCARYIACTWSHASGLSRRVRDIPVRTVVCAQVLRNLRGGVPRRRARGVAIGTLVGLGCTARNRACASRAPRRATSKPGVHWPSQRPVCGHTTGAAHGGRGYSGCSYGRGRWRSAGYGVPCFFGGASHAPPPFARAQPTTPAPHTRTGPQPMRVRAAFTTTATDGLVHGTRPGKMDTLGFEPRAVRMRSGCDTTTPCARVAMVA